MSYPQIWKIEKEEYGENESVRRQASEAQREKELEREKKKKDAFFVGGATRNFVAEVRK